MKRISIQDIANEVNLSKTTVSWILNNKGKENNISQETIDKVLAIAKELNYVPNYLAKSLSLGKSHTIGLIVPRITDSFFAQVATILEKEARKKGYTVVYGSAEENQTNEHNLINTFLGKQVDGLIIASSLRNKTDIERLINIRFPFVLIDRHYPSMMTNYVVVEDEIGAHSLVSSLLHKKKKRIGMITVSSFLLPIINRQAGYTRALSDFNIPPDPSLIKEVCLDDVETSVHHAVKEFVVGENPVDAIFFVTHYLASAGYKSLKKMNFAIPDDVAVCCFGDSAYLELLEPPITAIPMPSKEISKESLRILLKTIESKEQFIEQVVLPVEIMHRNSC